MSRLLLVHAGAAGRVELLLADVEATESGVRVFRRHGKVVLRAAPDEVVLVRDVRTRTEIRQKPPKMPSNPYTSDNNGP